MQKPKVYPKSDVRFWRERVFKPVTVRKGTRVPGLNYAVQFQYRGTRRTFGLETANRDEAASKARRLYADLVLGGWDSLLKRHRPKPPAPETSATITFGQL